MTLSKETSAMKWLRNSADWLDFENVLAASRAGCEITVLVHEGEGYVVYSFIDDVDSYDYGEPNSDFGSEDYEDAVAVYKKWAAESEDRPVEPDWEAQARYDEAHGTINGSDPGVVAWQELHAYECGE